MQNEIYVATGLGIVNLYYNTIALEKQGLSIDDSGRVMNGDKEVKPKDTFSNIIKLNKNEINKRLDNLGLV